MWLRSNPHISFVPAVALMLLSLSACNPSGTNPALPEQGTHTKVVYRTDSTEWMVSIFQSSLFYSDAVEVTLPAPFVLPTREQAAVLRELEYSDNTQRFVTSDGYTFGMPSASVSKAGSKTKYSVLGLYIRSTVIRQDF